MWETSPPRAARPRGRTATRGAFAIEFAIVILVFFTLVFGVMEMARLMYVVNTMQEVTRRAAHAAANKDFSDAAGMDLLRQSAIFRSSAGELVLGAPIQDKHIRIDYMALMQSGASLALTPIAAGSMPTSPTKNRLNCVSDPNGASCIRFVRVRLCDPGDTDICRPVVYVPIFSLINLAPKVPRSTTIVRAESLGYSPGKPL